MRQITKPDKAAERTARVGHSRHNASGWSQGLVDEVHRLHAFVPGEMFKDIRGKHHVNSPGGISESHAKIFSRHLRLETAGVRQVDVLCTDVYSMNVPISGLQDGSNEVAPPTADVEHTEISPVGKKRSDVTPKRQVGGMVIIRDTRMGRGVSSVQPRAHNIAQTAAIHLATITVSQRRCDRGRAREQALSLRMS